MSRVSVVDCQVKSSQAKLGLVFKTKAKDAIIVQGPLKQMDGTWKQNVDFPKGLSKKLPMVGGYIGVKNLPHLLTASSENVLMVGGYSAGTPVGNVGKCPQQVLAATLTLSQPGGADYPHPILVSTPSFESHRRA